MLLNLPQGTTIQGTNATYTIVRVLGQGSFGITYLAKTQIAGTLGTIDVNVAVKEFFMKEINSRSGNTVTGGSSTSDGLFDKYRQKFRREAKNLSRMQHPGIVKVLDSFDANGTSYIVMDYVCGGSLDSHIAFHPSSLSEKDGRRPEGGLPEEEALRLTRGIGDALAYMHAHHMLHLDLKPSNVMLNDQEEPILIDFGLSKHYDENGAPESSTTVGGGTPGYAPLEQASYRDGKGFPVTIDIYALGATLFKMLTGQRPPEADEIMNDGFPKGALKGVSQKTAAAVAKAMSFRKADRYQSVDEFLAALEATVSNDETTTVEEKRDVPEEKTNLVTKTTKKEPPKKSHRGFIYLGIAAIIVAVAVIILVSQTSGDTDYSYDDETEIEDADFSEEDMPSKDEPVVQEEVTDHAQATIPAGYVDLKLPSGTLWKNTNEGYHTYDEAIYKFGNRLPSETQWDELRSECSWTWAGSGYNVTGKNGATIYLPAEGFRNCEGKTDFVGVGGNYWSSTPDNEGNVVALRFRSNKIYTYHNRPCNAYSIRLVQN